MESSAHVYIASSSPDRVSSAISDLKATSSSGSIQGRAIDLRSEDSVKQFVDWVAADTEGEKQQGIDHVVFTAGDALMLGHLMDTDLDAAKAVSPSP